ncbi:MAG TPA: B-box zinc finger protein, partial [Armatimonadota bacterium]|nr:B-box zinc finger protein [Armatimonadota bacterium]
TAHLRPGVRPGAAPHAAAAPPVATVMDVAARCARHPRRPALGHCGACGKPVCRQCARKETPPYFCLMHAPVVLFGISMVRLEVALAWAVFLLLLLSLRPLGHARLFR